MSGPWDKYKEKPTASGPWSKYQAKGLADPPRGGQFSETESGMAGSAQGFGYDFLDELYGARRGVQDVLPFIGDHPITDLPDRYRARRDEARDYYNEAQRENPISYGAGYMGGATAGAFVPGYNLGKVAKGGQIAAKVGPKLGALAERLATPIASGAVASLGASDKDSTLANIEDAAKGGVASGVISGALGKVGITGAKMRRTANEKAVKASGAMTKEMRKLGNSGFLDAQGDYLLRNKVVTPLASLEDVAERSNALRGEAGERIGSIIDEVDGLREQAIGRVREVLGKTPAGAAKADDFARQTANEFGYNFNNVAQGIDGLIHRDARIAASKFHRERLSSLADEFRRIGEGGSGTLRDGLRNKTEHRRLLKDVDSLGEEYKQEVYDLISGELNRSVSNMERLKAGVDQLYSKVAQSGDQVALPPSTALDLPMARPVGREIEQGTRQAIDKFKQANRDYAASAVAEKTANDRLGQVRSNRDLGLTTAVAVAAGLSSGGGAPAAVAMGWGNNFFRKYGSTLQARMAYRVANALESSPQMFGKYSSNLEQALRRGPRQFVLTNFLIGKSDPQYATFLDKLLGGDEQP